MSILDLYHLAHSSDVNCIEYTGFSRQQLSELLPFFSIKVAKSLSNEVKLFSICYAIEKKLSGKSMGHLLFSSNYERDGNNFIDKAQKALVEAQAKAFPAQQIITDVVIKHEIKSEIKKEVLPVLKLDHTAPLGLSES